MVNWHRWEQAGFDWLLFSLGEGGFWGMNLYNRSRRENKQRKKKDFLNANTMLSELNVQLIDWNKKEQMLLLVSLLCLLSSDFLSLKIKNKKTLKKKQQNKSSSECQSILVSSRNNVNFRFFIMWYVLNVNSTISDEVLRTHINWKKKKKKLKTKNYILTT